ncbi:hypothetical protein [Oceanobacillus sp. CAU 1775]
MYSIMPSTKREKARRKENKLYHLVNRKESEEREIDDLGRSIIIGLQDYRQQQNKSIKYKTIMTEAKRYIRLNQKYL